MPTGTVTQSNVIPMSRTQQDLQTSAHVPIVALVLYVARQQRLGLPRDGGAQILLEGWAKLATEILQQMGTTAPELQHARRVAQRAIRIFQGYEPAARDKGYQCLIEYLEGPRGVDRELTDEELVAINNGMLHAFAGYSSYLDHTAGAVAGGAR